MNYLLYFLLTYHRLNTAHFNIHQCTGVAERIYIITKTKPLYPKVRGDAKYWINTRMKKSKEPKMFSVAVMTGGRHGHVGTVINWNEKNVLLLDRNYKYQYQYRIHEIPRNQITIYLTD